MGRGYLTYFVILMPTIRQKMGVFCSNAEESVYALCWYFIVGADLYQQRLEQLQYRYLLLRIRLQ